jgi:hypothetical protein
MLHKNYNIFSNKKGFSHDIRWVSLRGKMTASVLENWGIMLNVGAGYKQSLGK